MTAVINTVFLNKMTKIFNRITKIRQIYSGRKSEAARLSPRPRTTWAEYWVFNAYRVFGLAYFRRNIYFLWGGSVNHQLGETHITSCWPEIINACLQ